MNKDIKVHINSQSDTSEASYNEGFNLPLMPPNEETIEDNKIETNGMFVGLYVIEFDTTTGEKISYKHVLQSINPSVEKELVNMLMGADYYGYSSVTILMNTITNYHVISIHFTCYNPSNTRGFVTTCCISVIQSIPFTTSQTDLLIERLTQLSSKLQGIALRHTNFTKEYDKVMSFQELIDSTDTSPGLFLKTIQSFGYNLLSTHNHYNLSHDFTNCTHAANIIPCGGRSLMNWSFSTPKFVPCDPINSVAMKQSMANAIRYIKSNQFVIDEHLNAPYPPCNFADPNLESNSFDYKQFITEFKRFFPNIIFSMLSGLQLIIYSSEKYDISKMIDIARFISTFTIGGMSTETNPNIQIVDNQESLQQLQTRYTQIYVISEETFNLTSRFANFCQLDVSKSFYGMSYNEEMKGSILHSFVVYALENKPFLAQKMWNVLVEYSQLTMKCFFNPEITMKLSSSPERFIVQNFERKIEQERIYTETKQIVFRRPIIAKNMFVTVQIK